MVKSEYTTENPVAVANYFMDMLLWDTNFSIDPIQIFKDSGIDTWLVLLPTTVSPAHYAIDIVCLISLTG